MNTVIISALSIAVLFTGKHWIDARAEAAELRAQVAHLKRRLTRSSR